MNQVIKKMARRTTWGEPKPPHPKSNASKHLTDRQHSQMAANRILKNRGRLPQGLQKGKTRPPKETRAENNWGMPHKNRHKNRERDREPLCLSTEEIYQKSHRTPKFRKENAKNRDICAHYPERKLRKEGIEEDFEHPRK